MTLGDPGVHKYAAFDSLPPFPLLISLYIAVLRVTALITHADARYCHFKTLQKSLEALASMTVYLSTSLCLIEILLERPTVLSCYQ